MNHANDKADERREFWERVFIAAIGGRTAYVDGDNNDHYNSAQAVGSATEIAELALNAWASRWERQVVAQGSEVAERSAPAVRRM